ncbi:DUF6249 domain-containing protein [Chitinophaga silvisoli]|uniref:DUF6249 domain-containing protein n=1 Tax=Chitinophaga silvisoli TaxID=2291814 RepID=A0A3E1NX04_9BACT|nr:DUF6249 domain-containing protein [Chitinophaga silvisoli]RFM32467.1 hypothetical protein DXN04_22545 [Chitinophaga silvisoli]
MNEITRDCIVSLAAFAAIFGIAYIYLVSRHRERMNILEKGADASMFIKEGQSLKYGLLAVGIALGILAGAQLKAMGVEKNTSYLSMVFLFSGISLIIYYLISRRSA